MSLSCCCCDDMYEADTRHHAQPARVCRPFRARHPCWGLVGLLDNSWIRQLADCQLADWTSRGLENSRMPPATACLVFVLLAASARPRLVQSATCPVREISSPRIGNPRVGVSASCPVTACSESGCTYRPTSANIWTVCYRGHMCMCKHAHLYRSASQQLSVCWPCPPRPASQSATAT